MSWMVFSNFESGQRGFEFFDDECEALESMGESLRHYKEHGVSVEMGVAEITHTEKVNWN